MEESALRINNDMQLSQFLTFETCHLTKDLIERARTELNENIESRTMALEIFKAKIKDEKNLVGQTDDLFLLAFLRTRKFNVDRAFYHYTHFYSVTGKYSKIFKNIDFRVVRQTLEDRPMGFLPYRNRDGTAILYFSIKDWDPYKQSLTTLMQGMICGAILALRNPVSQVAGFTAIVDIGDLSLRHLPHVSPTILWLVCETAQNFGARVQSINVVNVGLVYKSFWMIMKPMFSKKMRKRIRFFGNNWTGELHKFVPPEILPAEYGGKLPPFDNTNWRKQVFQHEDYITQCFQYGYRE